MRFRPCIDLHQGVVKQIVGATLTDEGPAPQTNFQARRPADWYARRYRQDGLTGGHIIQLGPDNETAARSALAAWPGGMQIGGGITAATAADWIEAGAAAVIVTSWVFYDGRIDEKRLQQLVAAVGRRHIVLDLSCRRQADGYLIATNRWQTLSDEWITPDLLVHLAQYCDEFLVHAVDVEGRCNGIESPLVQLLGQAAPIATTYAGGIRSQKDIETIEKLGAGRIDFTVGSALDIFGGRHLQYEMLAKRYCGT